MRVFFRAMSVFTVTACVLSVSMFPVLAGAESPEMPAGGPIVLDVATISERLFFSTVRIESEKLDPRGESFIDVSTGFIITFPLGEGRRADFLVTSRHSIEGAMRGRFFFIRSREGKPSLGETYRIQVDDFENKWIVPQDGNIDIAIMPLAGILRELSHRSWDIYYRGVSPQMAYGPGREEEFDAIEEIILIGYPSGVFDAKNFIPVARRGITATPLRIDYMGKPQFLIDAAVFPGSSGSPVFIVNRGMYPDRQGRIKVGERVVFLGMLSSLAVKKHTALLELDGRSEIFPHVSTEQPMGIGVVYKSPVIFDLIRELFMEPSQGETFE